MVRRNTAQQDRMREHVRKVGGNCRLCGEPIDYSIPYFKPGTREPNPEAFVADHIIPLHKGGRHDVSNAQAAHVRCNSKKRARIDAPIVRRSGSLG